jgi:hypothetical protein
MEQEKAREPTSKLQMDNPSDFRFHVAYMAYSEAWEDNQSEATRTELNEMISSLSTGKASYEEFYANLTPFRKQRVEFHRERIQSQRKRDWRRSEKKSARDARHKK